MAESGYSTLLAGAWTAMLAPKATPPAIVAKLNAAANAALQSEQMSVTLAKIGAQARGGTPQALADYIAGENKKWGPIVKALDLKVE